MNFKSFDKKTVTVIGAIALAFVIVFAVVMLIIAVIINKNDEPGENEDTPPQLISEMNGVWIASVSNIDFPSRPDLSQEELKAELDAIVETVAETGLDTIFFQVRPSSDALYRSSIFPVSRYLSTRGELTLDCLEYIIDIAGKKDISVHAWINPLRVATGGTVDDLDAKNPAAANPAWCTKYADGKIYYDCGTPAVREMIAEGVREIVENYDVKGIVFDDYFYPYPYYETDEEGNKIVAAFADNETFSTYGTEYDDIGDWRRENVNQLVRLCYEAVKDADEKCVFGVSPFGIWKNGYGDESGSATRGAQSYFDIYCDSLAWAKGGYVDYIAPQLYWTADNISASYTALTEWWSGALKDTGTAFLVSHAAYRYEEWDSPSGIITSQVENAAGYEDYRGSIFYGYEEISNNTEGITEEIKKLYK